MGYKKKKNKYSKYKKIKIWYVLIQVISVITLTVNGLNVPIKKTTANHMLYVRHSLYI